MAAAWVALAFVVRLLVVHAVGEIPTYITFYPAVMLAALLGPGPGFFATFLSAMAVAYWILPPVGQLRISSTADAVGLALFTSMGVFMSVVAMMYRRARERAAVYEKELALRRSEEKLFATQQRLHAIMQATPVGVSFSDDASCQRVTGNRAVQAQFEIETQGNLSASALDANAPGRRVRYFRHGRELASSELPLQRAVAENQAIPPTELEVVLSSGRRWFCESSAAPVRDAQGNVIGGVAVTVDITDRKDVQDSYRRAKEAAEAANKAKDFFLAMVSHELRTPLTPVLAAVSHLRDHGELAPALRDDLEMIQRNVVLEARMVDDLLSLTRLTRGKIVLHQEAVDAHAMIRAVVSQFRPEIDGNRVELGLDLRADGPFVWADPTRFKQVLSNLLSNAVKFTPAGGRIAVRTSNDGGRFRIEVSDTGIGIEPEVIARLFNPFEQGEQTVTRKYGGLGLGLSIAKQFVELHGGTLAVASGGKNQGSTFTVELPAASTIPAAAAQTPAAPAERSATLSILLVEDHLDTVRTLGRLLKQMGFTVETAAGTCEARSKVEQRSFDVLVSDLGLPDGNGLDLVRELRNRGAIHYAIALSGYGSPEDLGRSKDAGFHAHLVKPIDFACLRDALAAAANARAPIGSSAGASTPPTQA
ncbi:MAG: ATP-binding protein [Tepidisphaeraceae bacterium]|jgi:two-component system CheB/CheR fusion protein